MKFRYAGFVRKVFPTLGIEVGPGDIVELGESPSAEFEPVKGTAKAAPPESGTPAAPAEGEAN